MLTGVVTILLLIVALLAIPLTLTFRVFWQQDLKNDFELKWIFGLVHVRFPSPQLKAPSPVHEDTKQINGRFDRPTRKKKQHFFVAIWNKKFRRRILKYIRDLWHSVHKENISLHMRIGLGDPADTGQLWAIFGPMSGILASIQEASIDIQPEFLDTTFELDSSGSIRIIPLQMIFLTVALMLSPPMWQGIRQMRKALL
jgi:hypothetical protein